MRPITVIGSYNASETIRVLRLPRPGETVMGTGYSKGPGGKGSNQAVAARRLNGEVRFIGCVGRDRSGDEAFLLWESEGIASERVRRVAKHTGTALIVVSEGTGANAITIAPGANLDLSPADIAESREAIAGCGVVLTQLEISVETATAATKVGREEGTLVILNPAPAVPASELNLSQVDVITPNEQEFRLLAGTDSLEGGSAAILKRGPRTVIVTLGERGAYVATESGSYTVHAPRVKAVDETGAGDAFNGALAVALSEGEDMEEAVRLANAAGALTVTKEEVIPALPRKAEVEALRRQTVQS
ncbi:MAG: ribokinase [Nitrososphaerota archaeon]|jgi:ribokinase|nr:ribokinase [Nitrososphaerota archaeon]